ncbi:MAG: alpha-ketoglutarate-dependent dioxygenase AlkB [Roseofilum sp. SID1]|uniref:alpha-ketoglutarate-dependent dioxygenase AlkB n=1 Tax=Roseofilum sp. SID2 TaxID=2821498 RepID=UPI001B1579B7|nr:alpha-ketoglutarate-dependent dioxygenase AlkB [Roseofilum sp. SID2]MBP0036250.1 alpha-ketoglutarate-dependent dioxygenase AlkB [Roseofilum sp. SID1]
MKPNHVSLVLNLPQANLFILAIAETLLNPTYTTQDMKIGSPNLELRRMFWLNHEDLFSKLRDTVVWDESMKTRKTASFGVSYNYSQMTYPETQMHPELEPVCAAISDVLGFTPNNGLLNFYPDGNASMGFHSDTAQELAPGTGVAILSLGASRTITYKLKENRTIQHSYRLDSGDLLYMSNEVQADWLHGILKEPDTGSRISITLRKIAI